MTTKSPRVSVIMPAYNCVHYIQESVNSILTQTFGDFEFIIIDDSSTDGTLDYLKTITDQRVVLIQKPQNTGYTISLNKGLELAKGDYIVRMDADDISLPQRIQKQVEFMDANPEIVCAGSSYKIIPDNRVVIPKHTSGEILLELIITNPLAHPSVIIRSEIIKNNSITYDKTFEPAEDYKMWTELSKYGKLANIEEVLLHYRLHKKQVSVTSMAKQKKSAQTIAKDYTSQILGSDITEEAFYNYQMKTYADYEAYLGIEKRLKTALLAKGYHLQADFFLPRRINYVFDSFFPDQYSFELMQEHLKIKKEISINLPISFFIKYLLKTILHWKRTN
jgi:glycosyltransferase involved in cell wall biosynthesis